MVTRTAVAHQVATTLMSGGNREQTINEAAAWLVAHGKSRQAAYLAKDVAQALAEKGYVFAEITTARPISGEAKQLIEAYIRKTVQADQVECEYKTDKKLIGGVLISTPYGTLDASVKAALATIIEGVSR